MKLSRGLWSVGVLALCSGAFLTTGCSKGSGGSSSSSQAAAGVSTSTASSRPNGVAWEETDLGQPGAVTALSTAPLSTLTLVGVESALEVVVVGPTLTSEAGFTHPVTSIAVAGSAALAGTGEAGVPGSGKVYLRQAGTWQPVVNGAMEHALVVALGGDLYALQGELGQTPRTSFLLGGAGAWTHSSSRFQQDCIPTEAISHQGELWIGAQSATAGDGALLFHGTFNVGFQAVPLPSASLPAGSVERVTALASHPGGGLVVGIAIFDSTTGQVLAGRLLHYTAFQTFDVLMTFNQDAPLALVGQDGTFYVGTSAGRLLYQDPRGQLLNEPNLPTNLGITRLLAPDRDTLLVGARTARGATLFARRALTSSGQAPVSSGSTGSAPGGGLGYADIKPALQSCVGCHSTMTTGLTLSAGLADDAADHSAVAAAVDVSAPDMSVLLTKASNTAAHAGGALWALGSADYVLVRDWIQQGANLNGSGGTGAAGAAGAGAPVTPPLPPPSAGGTFSYLTHIKPALQSCVGCHATQSNYLISTGLQNDQSDYQSTLAQINNQVPDASPLLLKGSGTSPHAGGGPWPTNSATYATVVQWIQQGAPYAGGTAPAQPAVPVKPTYLVDVRPIMSTCVGCHKDEKDDFPLSANLADDPGDYSSALKYITLGNPAGSQLLTRATKQRGHPVKVFDVGSQPYDVLLAWITAGAPYN
jgi:hypothetical protein